MRRAEPAPSGSSRPLRPSRPSGRLPRISLTRLPKLLRALNTRKATKVSLDHDSYAAMALSFLLGRTVLAGSLAPFAPALYGGLRPFGGALPVLCGIFALLGSASLGRWDYLGYHVLAFVLITACVRPGRVQRTPTFVDSLLVGGVVAVSRGIVSAIQAPIPYSYISSLFEGLCAVTVSLLMSMAFAPDRGKTQVNQEKGSEALLVVALLSLGGLQRLSLGGVSLEVVAAMGCTLAVGYATGPGAGAIAGLAGGLMVSLTGNGDPAILGVMGASGLLAGIGGWFGKIESVLAFISAGLLTSLHSGAPGQLSARLAEQAISCISIILVTPAAVRVFGERFPVLTAGRTLPRARIGPEAAAVRTAAVAHALLEIGEMFAQASTSESLPEPASRASGRSHRSGGADGTQGTEVAMQVSDTLLLRQAAERVCAECDGRSVCWEEKFGETFEAFSDLTREIQVTGRLTQRVEHSGLADRCQRFSEVVAAMNHQQELQRLERRIRAMDGETKDCLAFQYRCLGQLLTPATGAGKGRARGGTVTDTAGVRSTDGSSDSSTDGSVDSSMDSSTGGLAGTLASTPTGNVKGKDAAQDGAKDSSRLKRSRLKVTIKGVSTPAGGSSCSGDMWVKYDLSPGKSLVILVDGMGKGDAAARQSRETIGILKSLLDCGLDYDSCVSFLNSALFLSCRPDGFIAVDSLLVDEDTERAYFHKLGAPPSFIRKRDGNVLVVRGSRPPAGAFNAVPCFATSEPVSSGDEIYMVSDGIFRSSPIPARAEHLLVSRLRRMKGSSLDAAVRMLLGQGQGFRGAELPDDVTVVGARIERM